MPPKVPTGTVTHVNGWSERSSGGLFLRARIMQTGPARWENLERESRDQQSQKSQTHFFRGLRRLVRECIVSCLMFSDVHSYGHHQEQNVMENIETLQ